MPKSGHIHRQEEVQRFYRMVATETDINESLKTLAQDAENARLYNSPPDAIVMRAIELGMDSRADIRRATGYGYDVIEKCLERHPLEVSFQTVGQVERLKLATFKPMVAGPKDLPPPIATAHTGASETAREAALVQRNAPMCVTCHNVCIMSGVDRNGRQRWRCRTCDFSFLGSGEVNQIKKEKRELAVSLFRSAKSVRQVAAEVGISTQTAQKIRDEEIKEPILCPCGKDAKRQGWCKFRYEQSPARQAVMEKVHMGHIDPHEEAEARVQEIVARAKESRKPLHVELGPEEEAVVAAMRDEDEPVNSGYQVVPAPAVEHCFCGREQPVGGKHRGTHRNKASRNGQKSVKIETEVRTEIAQPIVAETVEPDKKQDKMIPAQQTTSTEIYQGVRLHQDIQVCAQEIAQWPRAEIAALIGELARVADIPLQRPMPKTIKRAWSKEFENDDDTQGLSMLYLVSMLHDGMEDHEKQAVWTLIQYLKRMQAALEVA